MDLQRLEERKPRRRALLRQGGPPCGLPYGSPLATGAAAVTMRGAVTADGREAILARERAIRALVAGATPLLGMALLRGSEPRVRVEGAGEVQVAEIPGSQERGGTATRSPSS